MLIPVSDATYEYYKQTRWPISSGVIESNIPSLPAALQPPKYERGGFGWNWENAIQVLYNSTLLLSISQKIYKK